MRISACTASLLYIATEHAPRTDRPTPSNHHTHFYSRTLAHHTFMCILYAGALETHCFGHVSACTAQNGAFTKRQYSNLRPTSRSHVVSWNPLLVKSSTWVLILVTHPPINLQISAHRPHHAVRARTPSAYRPPPYTRTHILRTNYQGTAD